MNKILMSTAAILALLASPSLSMAAESTTSTTTTSSTTTNAVPAMTDGIEASAIMKADIKDKAGKTVGAMQDVLINREGVVVGVVADVGSFLGVGQRDVLLDWKSLTIQKTGDVISVTTDLDKKAIQHKLPYKVSSN